MTDEIVCRRCEKKKRINCFAINRRICKECKNKENKEYRLKNIRKDKQNKRSYYIKNRKDTIKRGLINHKSNLSYNDYQTRYKNKLYKSSEIFRFKHLVQVLTRYYFTKDETCGLCGSKNLLNFHHWRYRIPVQISDFSTLCYWCHKNVHLTKDKMLILGYQNG
jgi:hypothetical protein